MKQSKNKALVDAERLQNDAGYRKEVCRHSIYHFAAYYFSKYITHDMPDFHTQMYEELEYRDDFFILFWIMYRDSAKTALARIKVTHNICYEKKKFMPWVGFDKNKAKLNVQAIANELQENKKIIRDFGQLYFAESTAEQIGKRAYKQKSISQFVTENGIMVQAISTGTSLRGESFGQYRPDFVVLDDFENEETKKSFVKTQSVIKFLGEVLTSKAISAQFLILANYITKTGSVEWFRKKAIGNPDIRVHMRALIEKNKEGRKVITWPGKWVWTDEEKHKINATKTNEKEFVESIASEKRTLGSAVFEQEKLNIPMKDGNSMVRREWFQTYSKLRLFIDGQKNWWYRFDGDKDATKASIVVLSIDPSISKKQTSDERAIITLARFDRTLTTPDEGTIKKSYFLIFKSNHGRWTMAGFAEKLAGDRDSYHPHRVGCESNGVQEAFRELFAMYGISAEAINPDTDKVRRLQRHIADVEFGYVLVPDDGTCEEFIEEITEFTGEAGKQDNQVDAFSQAMYMAKEDQAEKFFGAVI